MASTFTATTLTASTLATNMTSTFHDLHLHKTVRGASCRLPSAVEWLGLGATLAASRLLRPQLARGHGRAEATPQSTVASNVVRPAAGQSTLLPPRCPEVAVRPQTKFARVKASFG